MSQEPSQKPDAAQQQFKTELGRRTDRFLLTIWESLNLLGKGIFGELWRTLYLSVQDAIALSVLLQLPSLIGRLIIGKDFSSFDVCLQESPLGVSRYACFIIITSDFCLWIVLAGRIAGRFWAELSGLKRGDKRGSR